MPPFPLVAEPLERLMDPESPTLDVPVENNTSPLTPAVPAFTVYRNMEPLVVALLPEPLLLFEVLKEIVTALLDLGLVVRVRLGFTAQTQ